MSLVIGGLDPSLTSTGLVVCGPDDLPPLMYRIQTKAKGHLRLRFLLHEIWQQLSGCDVVVMEGLAFGAKGSAVTDLAGLHWLIRHMLWTNLAPYAIVDPRTRMKWLTGNGNASKDMCLAEAIHRFGYREIDGNDKADALTVAAMGCEHYGQPLVTMPADRTALLSAVKTPKGSNVARPVIDWPFLSRS
jgi:crossover junction endodeoxyribonuclease RuvC